MDEPTEHQARKATKTPFREYRAPARTPTRAESAATPPTSAPAAPAAAPVKAARREPAAPALPAEGTQFRRVYDLVVAAERGLTTAEIAERLSISRTAAATSGIQMMARGLVARWYDPQRDALSYCAPDQVPAGAQTDKPARKKRGPAKSAPSKPGAKASTTPGARLPYYERRCVVLERLAAITASDISAELRAIADFIRETHDA